ncbi:hypothetical protein QF026_004796 [Streptomyces aurantiacus]|uniref:hypothetical protein n=1 Tax=Streptomyces aurantiacus TaxID=47760 RepID=UPI002792586F|nr:hypothetical protein [Streptomyces aurantiacus]MDQ0776330.1 hypothetical protein [Streptomyces aurantiacus]
MESIIAMSQEEQARLGLLYVLIFFGFVVGIAVFISKKVAPKVNARQRRNQIEAAMHRQEYDRRVTEDVADEWGYDPRHHRRR